MQESGCTKPVSVREMRIESIPFSSIPNQSRLFLDYLADPTNLSQYYPSAVETLAGVADRAAEVLDHHETDRERLCDALARINSAYGSSDETAANIELLRGSNTVAVLTGQQTGLFTGPLYSIYKALSAVKMAEYLKGRGIAAVPVFWMATEDHDLQEVSNAFAVGKNDQLIEARIEWTQPDAGKPVGSVRFSESVDRAANAFFNALPVNEFTGDLKSQVERQWKAGQGFGKAFGSMLTNLLGKFGLIVVDPLDQEIKRLAAPVYTKAIKENENIVRALTERSRDLEAAGYAAQVLVEDDYFPLFYHNDTGKRVALRRTSKGTLHIKGESTEFLSGELAALAEREPARFSPGVMLRPVVQDHLFPTICYFGGGAEIAYFAQNSEVYRILQRPVTPILHRQSFTVIEAKHARTLEKYALAFSDLFAREDDLLAEIVDRFIDPATASLFAEAEENINTELNRLDQALSQMDVTLAANLATRRRKINYHVAALRKKYQLRRAEQDDEIGRRVKAAFVSVLPDQHLQERTLNVISFLDRFGPAFIDAIFDAIDLDDKGHRLVYL